MGGNALRFVAVWMVIASVVFAVIDFDANDLVPHSPAKALFLPIGLLLMVLIAAYSASVALILVSPVAAAALAVYLAVLWWSRRFVQRQGRRIVAILLALLPFALLRGSDGTIVIALLAVALTYSLIVSLPSDEPS